MEAAFSNISAPGSHYIGCVGVCLQGGTDIRVTQAGLNIFYVGTIFHKYCGMGVAQRVVIKGKLQLVMNNPAAVLKGICETVSNSV